MACKKKVCKTKKVRSKEDIHACVPENLCLSPLSDDEAFLESIDKELKRKKKKKTSTKKIKKK